MSNQRREAVAIAIEDVCPSLRTVYPDGPDYTAPLVLADAALAVIDAAEPTDAGYIRAECSSCFGKKTSILDPARPCGHCNATGIDPVYFIAARKERI